MAEIINTRDTVGDHESLVQVVGAKLSELVDDAVYSLYAYALYGNDGLESITLPNLRRAGYDSLRQCTRLSTLNIPSIKALPDRMCFNCTALTMVNAAEAESTGDSTFSSCTSLEMINLPKLKTLGAGTFSTCPKLADVFINNVLTVGGNAFAGCTQLQEISLPKATHLNNYAFNGCTKLTTVDIPNVTTIGQYVFNNCSLITSLNFPKLTSAGSYALYNLQYLTSLSIPLLRSIPPYFLTSCYRLHELNLDNVTSIGQYAFGGVPIDYMDLPNVTGTSTQMLGGNGPKVVDFHANVVLNNQAFMDHRDLIALILRAPTLRAVGSASVIANTPIAAGYGWVYVPDDLVDTYKSATNWSVYADRIVGISEYPKAVPGIIQDSWDEIIQAEQDGSYRTKYHIGDLKPVQTLETVYLMQIAAFDADELADGSGTAKITWISLGRKMNTINITNEGYRNYTWSASYLREWLHNDLYADIDNNVKPYIKEVHKVSGYNPSASTSDRSTVVTTDKIWVPSAHEIGIDSYSAVPLGETGPVYSSIFPTQESRAKKAGGYGTGTTGSWYLRTRWDNTSYMIVRGSYNTTVDDQTVTMPAGEISTSVQTERYSPVFGFCT